ncbi:AbrB/MazE/SpoVT family DNA-binding domain-containing protein [Anaerorhabdus sp.]|uniref:AbrB/MazE/SpoVT family DNA-binding domain-containing protein n=1 Tax=Anaerorhabdus sp. TaxID=1872524 RepID=UPI002FC5F628
MKVLNVTVGKNGAIELPKEMLAQMHLKEGEQIHFGYEPIKLAEKCFLIEEDMENSLEKQEFYCIPYHLIKAVGLGDEDLQIVLGKNELMITSSINVIGALPEEYLEALEEQNINLEQMADTVVERINIHVLESEKECL